MTLDEKRPALRIYIAQHCQTCAESLRLAREVEKRFPGIHVEVINLDDEGSHNLDEVFSVPTYVLDGTTIWLGNPDPDELFSRLAEALD